MSRIWIIFIALTLFSSQVFSAESKEKFEASKEIYACSTAEKAKEIFQLQSKIETKQTQWQESRRGNQGCCSHHSGVCGCAPNGHLQCCDGATSPSCGC
jgi:acetone carboxylase gamma subunit